MVKDIRLDNIIHGEDSVELLNIRILYFKQKMKPKSYFTKKEIKKIKRSGLLENIPLRYKHYFEDIVNGNKKFDIDRERYELTTIQLW